MKLGATHVINYAKEDMKARVKEICDGEGVDVVYEIVGGKVFDTCVSCLRSEGRLLVVCMSVCACVHLKKNRCFVQRTELRGFCVSALNSVFILGKRERSNAQVIGFAGGTIPSMKANLALVKGISLVGVRAGQEIQMKPQLFQDMVDRLKVWSEQGTVGQLAPVVGTELPLTRFRDAYTLLNTRGAVGKACVLFNEPSPKL